MKMINGFFPGQFIQKIIFSLTVVDLALNTLSLFKRLRRFMKKLIEHLGPSI